MGLKEEFLKLLREDVEFRYAVIGLIGLEEVIRRIDKNTEAILNLQEQVVKLQEQVRTLQEQMIKHSEAIRALQEQVERHSEAILKMQRQVMSLQEQVKTLQGQVVESTKAILRLQEQVARHSEAILALQRSIEKIVSSIQAIGTRCGVFTEEAFRESIKYLIGDLLKEYKVEKWIYYDEKGVVYGHSAVIEVDVLIKDREHILVEYKASTDRADVAELYRIGKLYEEVKGVRPRLLIVSPGIRRRAKELADRLGVELRGTVIESVP